MAARTTVAGIEAEFADAVDYDVLGGARTAHGVCLLRAGEGQQLLDHAAVDVG